MALKHAIYMTIMRELYNQRQKEKHEAKKEKNGGEKQ